MNKFVYKGWEFPSVRIEPPRERFLKLIACPDTANYDEATVLFSHIPPGSTTGAHIHPDSDEIMYCSGRGECVIGGRVETIETDTVIVAPKGLEHECRNTSQTDTLRLFCVYIPPMKLSDALGKLAAETRKYLANG
jgi:mannose-6-phosphate isomerase-like protein (cupin superfamily)